ncbi:hypothetical protein CR513_56154, partial [Mucuna pruriens]
MVHLVVLLTKGIRLCDPLFLRWMYLVEHYMKILKSNIKNPHRLEAYIVERCIVEEVIEFCICYMSAIKSVGVSKSRHEGRCKGKGTRGVTVKSMEVQSYLSTHQDILKKKNPRINKKWITNEHNKTL